MDNPNPNKITAHIFADEFSKKENLVSKCAIAYKQETNRKAAQEVFDQSIANVRETLKDHKINYQIETRAFKKIFEAEFVIKVTPE